MSVQAVSFDYMGPQDRPAPAAHHDRTCVVLLLRFGRANANPALSCSVFPVAAQSVVQDNATAPSGNRQLLAAVLFALSVAILLPVLPPGGAGGSDNLFL